MYCHDLVSAQQITRQHLLNKCESLCCSSLFHFTLRCDSCTSMQQPPKLAQPGHTRFLSLTEDAVCSQSPDCHKLIVMQSQPYTHAPAAFNPQKSPQEAQWGGPVIPLPIPSELCTGPWELSEIHIQKVNCTPLVEWGIFLYIYINKP